MLVSCSRGWSKYRCSTCVHVEMNVYVFYITTVLIYSVYFWCVDTIFCNLLCADSDKKLCVLRIICFLLSRFFSYQSYLFIFSSLKIFFSSPQTVWRGFGDGFTGKFDKKRRENSPSTCICYFWLSMYFFKRSVHPHGDVLFSW